MCYRAIMPYISPRDSLPGLCTSHIPDRGIRGVRMNDASRESRTKEKRERIQRKKDRIARGANKRCFASAYNERKEGQPNAYTLAPFLHSSLTLRAFGFPYSRHRLPFTVSQRSLCNILSSHERCAIRFRVRVRTTLVCVSPGQVNVLRLAVRRERRAARKKGVNGK